VTALAKYRVTYVTTTKPGSGQVKLSEILEAEDLESALDLAKDWAEREGWILKAVEELEE